MNSAITLLLLAWAGIIGVQGGSAVDAKPAQHGAMWFHADFETTNSLQGWTGASLIESGYLSARALAIESKGSADTAVAILSLRLPVEDVRGCMVRISAMARAENVSRKPNPWNGIKCMLAIETPDEKVWPQASIETGTFDWRRAAFTARIPTNASSTTLVLGLEKVTGRVWFDDVKATVVRPPLRREPRPLASPPFTGHRLPRLRGAMISPSIDAEGLRVLGSEWKANLIRWQLVRHGRTGEVAPVDEYDRWLEGELTKLDAALPLCETNGLFVVVDLHSPPGGMITAGGYAGSDDQLFTDPRCQAKFVEVWKQIATRYRDARAIWGFDLANEPVEDFIEEGCDDWQMLAERAALAIRTVDPERTIIVEPASWGGPSGFRDLAPLPVSNVVYSVHMYLPHAFTHQGVHGPSPAWSYPGLIDGKHWDKAALEAALRPVIEFQRAHGAHIYVGEFSAIRWAPGDSAYRYLKDLIEIFETHGWDWSYHAFREWSGWSVEHGPERSNTSPATVPTDRQLLLQQGYSQNQKPAW